jgi:hypothetical protein
MTKKQIIFQIIMIPITGFWFYMSVLGIIRGSKNYNDLTSVNGLVIGHRNVIHVEPPNRFGKREKVNVIAFSVTGFDKEFGITEREKIYTQVKEILSNKDSIKAQMYYDSKGQRIEDDISLHIFELKFNDLTIKTLQDEKNSERKGTLIFFLIGLFFVGLNIYGIKGLKKKATHNTVYTP